MRRIHCRHVLSLAFAFSLLAADADAVDGVAEINHTCANQTGCFPGDASGYPVTIDGSAGGSYRLTSNLVVPDENSDGISVSAPRITIDLNGFEILRAGCEGATTACTPSSGAGSGVDAELVPGVAVRNGSITGMGNHGVLAGMQARVSDLRVQWCRVSGIDVDDDSRVVANLVRENGGDGIVADPGTLVADNVVNENGGDGIVGASGSWLRGNVAMSNGGIGLRLPPTAAYRENGIAGNVSGTVSFGLDAGGNACNGSTTCP